MGPSQPAFEAWPPKEGEVHLHSTIIGMYGSPIGTQLGFFLALAFEASRAVLTLVFTGEFFDTERLR